MGPKDLPELDPFPNPFIVGDYDYGARKPLTLVEIEMMMLSGTIRNKPDWWEKRKDSTITSKWREEAVSQGATKDAFEYVLAELERYDSMREGKIQAASIDGVWQADNLIPQELVDSLNEGVAKLENIPDHLKDWHPGSNEQVNVFPSQSFLDLKDIPLYYRCWIWYIHLYFLMSLALPARRMEKRVPGTNSSAVGKSPLKCPRLPMYPLANPTVGLRFRMIMAHLKCINGSLRNLL